MWFLSIGVLLLIAVVDYRWRRIPHAVTIFGLLIAILKAPFLPAQFVLNSVVGAIVFFAIFWGIRLAVSKFYGSRAFGFGDVMLAALIGAIGGVEIGAQALVLGILLAGAYSAVALGLGWVSRRDTLPYGTFLTVGAVARFLGWHFLGRFL